MRILKIKALIYRYTGIYLASKEELVYVQSKEFWKAFRKIVLAKSNDMSMSEVQGLLIGSWQCDHGFYSVMYRGKYKVFKPVVIFYKQARMDIYDIFKSL